MTGPLAGIRVLSVAINLPGPAAVARLVAQGATATTVLPPAGDPLEQHQQPYFAELHAGQAIERLDLKEDHDRSQLETLLAEADVLVTSSRPSALVRLALDHPRVHERHPHLCQVDLVGQSGDRSEASGHDLTYQAGVGLIRDGRMPTSTVVDLAGAERAASEAAAALVERSRTGLGCRREVALSDVARDLARPVAHGLTTPGGLLGGALPIYAVYAAAEGRVALAALEPHFTARLLTALELTPDELSHERLAAVFAGRTAAQWQRWADEHDIPLTAVVPPDSLVAP